MSTIIREAMQRADEFHLLRTYLYNISPYYPEILIGVIDRQAYGTTILRKEHESVWYKEHHLVILETFISEEVHERIRKDITHKVYLSILFGVVDPEWRNGLGELLWEVDKNQQSEKERLIK